MILLFRMIYVICALGFVATIYFVVRINVLKPVLRFRPERDPLIRMNNGEDFVYTNTHSEYIPEYIISKRKSKKYIKLKYKAQYKTINYTVIEFNKLANPIKANYITDYTEKSESKIIRLKKKTKYVNVFVTKIDETPLILSPIKKPNIFKMGIYSILHATIAFFAMIMIHGLIVELLGGHIRDMYIEAYMLRDYGICFIAAIVLGLIYFIILCIRNHMYRKKKVGDINEIY